MTLKGVQGRRITLDSLAPQFNAFSTAIENSINDRPAWFSWREALSGQASTRRETRQFLEIEPILDYNSLQPGQDATDAIRKTASDLGLSERGVTVRLTGTVPIADQEFGHTRRRGGAEYGAARCCRFWSFFGSRFVPRGSSSRFLWLFLLGSR